MKGIASAFWTEYVKARRSRVPLITALGFSLAPLMGGFFMLILKDPDAARRIGVLRSKADMIAGNADWTSMLQLLAQATAVGGLLLFSLIISWVFGREYSDRTAKDLLALPTSRGTIVWAKFILVAFWCIALTVYIAILGLIVGWIVVLPGWSGDLVYHGLLTIVGAALLTLLVVAPMAFAACAGGGYMAPMGAAIVALVLAQVLGAAGWGPIFPWSIPASFAGMGASEPLGPESYVMVGAVGIAGVVATVRWWRFADQR